VRHRDGRVGVDIFKEFILALVSAIVKAFAPALVKEVRDGLADTCEDSRPDPALQNRLQDHIRHTWGGAALGLAVCLFLSGCGVKTVYVPDGTPVRIREAIKAVKVWVMDADGKPKASVMDIPAGWYALSDPGTAR